MANKLFVLAACAAVAAVSVAAKGGVGKAASLGRKLDHEVGSSYDWSASDSSSSGHWPTAGGDSPVGVDNPEQYQNKLEGLWSLEKILLKLIYKAFAVIEDAKHILETAPVDVTTGAPILTDAQYETLYALEAKLSWLIKEICKIVFKVIKVAFGREDYAGYSFSSRRELAELASDTKAMGRSLWELPPTTLQYYPIFMPYAPKPWVGPLQGVDLECALAKLEGLSKLLYGLKGLAYRSLQVIKSIKEQLKAIDSATAADWSESSSSSSSSSAHVASGKLAKALAKLAHTEKWLGITFKEQVGFVLKIKALAYANPCPGIPVRPPINATLDRRMRF